MVSNELQAALDAAEAAAEVIRAHYARGIGVRIKPDTSPVTEADELAEKAIRAVLSGRFPAYGFYGEESGQHRMDAEAIWIVDPIDGTKCFVREIPFFSTQIALWRGGRPVLGVSSAPVYGELAWAEEGAGAFLNGRPIRVSDIADLSKATVSVGNIKAIARSRALLQNRSAPRLQRAEALKFLVHFIGDVPQPLHDIDRHDEGGNKVAVTFFDTPMSLHGVWDFGLIEKRTYDWGQYVTDLENNWLRGKDIHALEDGNPVDWALHAHAAAVNAAYILPEDLRLGKDYYQRATPVVDEQLALAGIRLARVLDEALGHCRERSCFNACPRYIRGEMPPAM